jgi:predicted aconitase with swiveling domain
MNELDVRILAPGAAIGPAAVLDEPLSLWGGLDPATGLLTDPHHPQHGMSLTRRVVVMPGGRGSSSSSSVLFELDLILAIGAMVADELYDVRVPVVVVAPEHLDGLRDGAALEITAEGVLRWEAL